MLTKSRGVHRVLAACLLASAVSGRALPQTSPDNQKLLDRLERLEQENSRLVEEIRELRSELTGQAATVPPATDTQVTERLEVEENRTAELAQSKVETLHKFPVSLTGMLLFNAFMNGKYSDIVQYPVRAAVTPGQATSGASFRQTVLGLKFNGPDLPGGGKATGTLYMDFFAGTQSALNNLLHIRIATLDLNWKNTTVTVGQDKPVISPREPSSLAQVGVSPLTGAGNLWFWQPQIRVEQRFSLGEATGLRAQGGVYQTSENYPANLPPAFAPTLERARPGYEGRLEFFAGSGNRRLEIAPGFHMSTSHVVGSAVPSRIVSFDWLARPSALIEFSGEFFHGQNVAGLGARQGFNILSSGVAIPVHTQAEWGQISLFPTAKLSFHAYAGEIHDRSVDLGPNGITRNFVYAGNLMYKLAPNVLAAFEASQARTQYLGSILRLNNHYDVALAYLF